MAVFHRNNLFLNQLREDRLDSALELLLGLLVANRYLRILQPYRLNQGLAKLVYQRVVRRERLLCLEEVVDERLAVEFAFETQTQHRLHRLAQWLQISGVCREVDKQFGPILNVSSRERGVNVHFVCVDIF